MHSMRTLMSTLRLVETHLIVEQQRHPEHLIMRTHRRPMEDLRVLAGRASVEVQALSLHVALLPPSNDRASLERAVDALEVKATELVTRLAQLGARSP